MSANTTQNNRLDIEIAGTVIPDAVQLSAMTFEAAVNSVPSLDLEFVAPSSGSAATMKAVRSSIDISRPNESITMTIGGTTIFSGVLTEQHVDFGPHILTLRLSAKHRLCLMPDLPRSAVFVDDPDSAVVNKLTKGLSITVAGTELLSLKRPQLVQYDTTDWVFLLTRCAANGVWLIPGPKDVKFAKPKVSPVPSVVIEQSPTVETPATVNDQSKPPRYVPDKANWSAQLISAAGSFSDWSIDAQKMNEDETAAKTALGDGFFDSMRWPHPAAGAARYATSTSVPQTERKAYVDHVAAIERLRGARGRFTLPTFAPINLGSTAEVEGFSAPLDGKGIVSAIRHTLRQGVLQTSLTLGLERATSISAERRFDLVIGKVAAHAKDSKLCIVDDQFRVKVRLPSWPNNAEVWARLLSPSATEAGGVCLYPSAGDEVALLFVAGDPSNPVIVGSTFNPKNKPPFTKDELPKRRAMLWNINNNNLGFALVNDSQVMEFWAKQLNASAKDELNIAGNPLTIAGGNVLLNGQSIEIEGKSIDINQGK